MTFRSLTVFAVLLCAGRAGSDQRHEIPLLWKNPRTGTPAHIVSFGFDRFDGKHWFVFVYNRPVKVADIRNVYVNADMDSTTGYNKAGGSDYIISVMSRRMSFFGGSGEDSATRSPVSHAYVCGNAVVAAIGDDCFRKVPIQPQFRVMMNTNYGKVRYFEVNTAKPFAKDLTITLPSEETENALAVGVCDVGRRIEAPSDVPRARRLEITGARNEYVPFQVVVFVPAPRRRGNVSLSWTELAGAAGRIPKAHIAAQTVDSVPLWEPVNPELRYLARSVPASEPHRLRYVPDRLLPYEEGTSVTGSKGYLKNFLKTFWMTVRVPPDVTPGTYEGKIRVTVTDSPNQEVTVTLKVRSFSIPKRPSLTVFGDLPRFAQYESDRFNLPKPERAKPYRLDYERCTEDLAAHRLALRAIGILPELSFSEDGQPQLDFADFDSLAHYVFDELQMNAKPAVPYSWVSTGHGYRYNPYFGPVSKDNFSEEFKRKYVATMRAVAVHLREKGWLDEFHAFICDEPHADQMDELRTAVSLLHQADSDLKPWYYGGAYTQLMDILNLWMVAASAFAPDHQLQGRIQKVCRRGDRMGAYNPKHSYVVNVPPAYLRTMYWWAYEENLYWMSQWTFGGSYILRNFACRNDRYWTAWVYPPTDPERGIWDSSIRWELTREGLVDYEYLKLLEKRAEQVLAQLPSIPKDVFDKRTLPLEYVRPVVSTYLSRTHDGALLASLRATMAEEIEQLSLSPLFLCTYAIRDNEVSFTFAGKPGTRVDYVGSQETIPRSCHVTVKIPRSAIPSNRIVRLSVSSGDETKGVPKYVLEPFADKHGG